MLNCCYAIFWMYGSKNILFVFPLSRKWRSQNFWNFPYPGAIKLLSSVEIIISGQKCCPHLKQTVWSIFVHNLATIEQKTKKYWSGVRGLMDPLPTYLTSKNPNPCRVNKKVYVLSVLDITKFWIYYQLYHKEWSKNLDARTMNKDFNNERK